MRSVLVAAVLLLGSSDVPTVRRGLAWVRANPMFCGAHYVMVQSQRHLDALKDVPQPAQALNEKDSMVHSDGRWSSAKAFDAPVAPKGPRRVGTGSEVIP